jgi:hypothetical protein
MLIAVSIAVAQAAKLGKDLIQRGEYLSIVVHAMTATRPN